LEALEGRVQLSGPSVVFANGFGTSGSPAPTTAEAVATDAGGATYITGGFSGTVTFGNIPLTSKGASNIYIAKINPTGTVAWAHRMGGSSQFFGDYGRGIAVDSAGNSYVTGFFYGSGDFGNTTLNGAGNRDIFVAKYDIAGNFIWAKSFGGTGSDLGQSIAVDKLGNLYVTGSFQNTMTVGGTTLTAHDFNDGFIMKLDNNGTPIWAGGFGGAGNDSGFTVTVDSNLNVYTTGIFEQSFQFGTTNLTSRGDTDAFVMKQNSSGFLQWIQQFGGAGHDDGTGVTVDLANNSVYATGDYNGTGTFGGTTLTSNGSGDIYLARINAANGNVVWAKGFGGSSQDAGFSVTTDGAGNVYTTGTFQKTVAFGGTSITSNGSADAYLAKFDLNGNALSVLGFGSAGSDQGMLASVGGPTGNVTVVGDYSGAFSVGNVPLPANGTGFVIQFSLNPITIKPPGDFLNLGYTQPSVYQPGTASWVVSGPNGVQNLGSFGTPNFGDIPVPGDYDGIGYTEQAYFRPSTAQWFAKNPTTGAFLAGTFGATNLYDIPIPGDYDGSGRTQIAVFRPSGWTAQWFVLRPNGGQLLASFGAPNLYDIPVPGDYDGTGRTQIAVFRPSTAQWFILRPNGGQLLATFGGPNFMDIPIPGDWDHVGYTEPAVFRPATGEIFVLGPNGGHKLTTFGATNYAEIPLLASIASLIRLGKIRPGGNGVSAAGAPSGGSDTTGAVVAPAATRDASTNGLSSSTSGAVASGAAPVSTSTSRPAAASVSPPAQLGVRSSVVVGQGVAPTTTKTDALSAALDDLFGSTSRF